MTYKQKICNRIIEKMEWWREAQWADHIDLHTKDAVITVMENVVDGIANSRENFETMRPIEPQRMRGGGTYIITERKTERVYFHIHVINADTAHHITLLEEYANKRNGIFVRTAARI